jgi:hypothetical protein
MNDAELEVFLGIASAKPEVRAKIMASITRAKRKVYESMSTLESEVKLWQSGFGPKPKGVIVCTRKRANRRRAAAPDHHGERK